MKTVVYCFAMLLSIQAMAQFESPTHWKWHNPRYFDGNMKRILKVSDGILAAGDKSALLKSADGQTWKQIPFAIEEDFVGMEFWNDQSTGFLFCHSGKVYKTINSGNDWSADNSFPSASKKIIHAKKVNDSVFVYFNQTGSFFTQLATLVDGGSWQIKGLKKHVVGADHPFYWSTRKVLEKQGKIYINKTYIDTIIKNNRFKESLLINKYKLSDELFYYKIQGSTKHQVFVNTKFFFFTKDIYYVYGGPATDKLRKTTDGGKTWIGLGNPPKINDIYFVDEFEHYGACLQGQIISTLNAGSLWTNSLPDGVTEFTSGTDNFLFSLTNLAQNSINKAEVYGYGYCIKKGSFFEIYSCIMKSTDWGKTWSLVCYYTSTNENYFFPKKFYALDNNTFIVIKYNKKELKKFMSIDSKNGAFHPKGVVEFINPAEVVDHNIDWTISDRIVDLQPFTDKRGFFIGDNNNFYKYRYNPTNGRFIPTLISTQVAPTSLNCLNFSDSTYGFVAGEGGKILRTNDGGNSWYDASVAGVRINNIQCISNDTAFVVSNNGGFFRTYNASQTSVTWEAKALKTYDSLYALHFFNGKRGYVIGNNTLFTTQDGGNTVTRLKLPFKYQVSVDTSYIKLPFPSPDKVYEKVNIGKATPGLVCGKRDFSSFVMNSHIDNLNSEYWFVNSSILSLGTAPKPSFVFEPLKRQTLNCFPNPVKAGETVVLEQMTSQPGTIWVYDVCGKQVGYYQNATHFTTTGFHSGIYFISYQSELGNFVSKLCVE